jgi:nucleotide-binding universal stress UspA family protein
MKIQRILVPTDFSKHADAALQTAANLAKKFGAQISILHVVEPPVFPAMTMAGAASIPAIQQEISRACTEQLEKIASQELLRGIQVRTLQRDGRPFQQIVDVAKEEGADMIVISTHGYTGFKHFMLGSTTEKVVRAAPCPVLTVRASAD